MSQELDLEQAIETMSDADKKAILNEQFDAELEKEAAAEVAETDLQNALYAYGALTADLEVQAEEAGDVGLSKEASEQFESAAAEIETAIDAGVAELGYDQIEDDAELHKVAMASAALIFEGYCDQLEKTAKVGKQIKGMYGSLKKHVGKLSEKAKDLGSKGYKMAKNNPGKATAIAAGTAAAGYGAKKLMDKKASEMTGNELAELVLEKQATLDVIVDGIEKLSARGGKMGAKLMKSMGHVKAMAKKHGKKHGAKAAIGAGGFAAGYMSRKLQKKD